VYGSPNAGDCFNPGAFPRYYDAASNKAVFRGILSVFGLGWYSAVIV
jgi:hypothetical protein